MNEIDLAARFAGPHQFMVGQALHDDFVQWLQALYPKVNCVRMCRRQTRRQRRASGGGAFLRGCSHMHFPVLTEAQRADFSRMLVGYSELLAPRTQTQENP